MDLFSKPETIKLVVMLSLIIFPVCIIDPFIVGVLIKCAFSANELFIRSVDTIKIKEKIIKIICVFTSKILSRFKCFFNMSLFHFILSLIFSTFELLFLFLFYIVKKLEVNFY